MSTSKDLLREALRYVPKKPWDDRTFLHARISRKLDEPVQHREYFLVLREELRREVTEGTEELLKLLDYILEGK